MEPITKDLISVLSELITLLESDGEVHWARWMRISKSRLEASDFSGITHLLGAYGGMGSFNDLTICQRMKNGKFEWADGHVEKNERLTNMRSKAWELADAIKRSQTRQAPNIGASHYLDRFLSEE
jgi:hypothetical protein